MTRQALLQAIAENPEQRTVRLIFADWLEEHADAPEDLARAERIRAQIKLERLAPCAHEAKPLQEPVQEILATYAKKWTKPLKRFAWKPEFRAGFIEHVQSRVRTFIGTGERLLKAVPTLTSVYFHQAANAIEELLDSQLLPRLRYIDLREMCRCGYCPIQGEITRLVQSPQLAGIRHLGLSNNRLEERTVRALAESPHLGSLRSLDLSKNNLTTGGSIHKVLLLLRTPWLGQLQWLDLSGMPLSENVQRVFERRMKSRLMVGGND
ncbi:MAG: TIGR02996 domain-containing protein [Gemmataceae bacterium]